MIRICKICQKSKDINEFESNKTCRYGRGYRCRKCLYQQKKTIIFNWYVKNKDKFNKTHKLNQKKYYYSHPEVVTAHRLARKFENDIKKDKCQLCGIVEGLHMHHPDYSKPLEVVTLCNQCHKNQHHYV